jgi:hypothetical protein
MSEPVSGWLRRARDGQPAIDAEHGVAAPIEQQIVA